MNVSCPECGSVFRVDPVKVPEAGVRARCSICGGIIPLSREADAPTVVSAQEEGGGAAAGGYQAAPSYAPPADEPLRTGGGYEDAAPSFEREAPPAPAPPTQRYDEQPAAPRRDPPGGGSSGILTSTAGQSGDLPARRPINPFLNNDPGMKAKRLARALVSDMITYQPQKREEGLRNNTLKQLFREEIKKSYEEYVEQVGRDVAESTVHFQEALNDILANGRKVF
jgi:predicted Zn finger-like uncharacterized protein